MVDLTDLPELIFPVTHMKVALFCRHRRVSNQPVQLPGERGLQ